MPPDQLTHDVLLNLLVVMAGGIRIDAQPGLLEGAALLLPCAGDEDDLELAPVQVVADDDLVAVPRERRAGLGHEQRLVCLELARGGDAGSTEAKVRSREEGEKRVSLRGSRNEAREFPRGTHLERHDVALARPLCDERFEDLRDLVHLDV